MPVTQEVGVDGARRVGEGPQEEEPPRPLELGHRGVLVRQHEGGDAQEGRDRADHHRRERGEAAARGEARDPGPRQDQRQRQRAQRQRARGVAQNTKKKRLEADPNYGAEGGAPPAPRGREPSAAPSGAESAATATASAVGRAGGTDRRTAAVPNPRSASAAAAIVGLPQGE